MNSVTYVTRPSEELDGKSVKQLHTILDSVLKLPIHNSLRGMCSSFTPVNQLHTKFVD